MEAIEASHYDILLEQLNAVTEQDKALADLNWKTFQDDFDQLAPRDKVYFREKLMQYNAAKQQYTQISTDLNLDKFSDHELDILIERIRNEKYS